MFYKFEKYIFVEKIIDVENVFACSKTFYEQEKEKMQKDDYEYPLILPDNSEKRRVIEQYLIDNDVNYNVDVELPNSILLKELILNNLGIGYINKSYISKELDRKELVIIDKFKNIPLDNVTIIYNSLINNTLVNDFVKYLKATIKKNNN